MADPVWVIIRRKNAASRARDIIYGHRARPLPKTALLSWARILGHYCGKGFMRYSTALGVAEEMAGLGLRPAHVGQKVFAPDLDESLREQYASALLAKAKELQEAPDWTAQHAEFTRLTDRARQAAWAREAALSGRCPACGDRDPERCGCGFGVLEPDGAGGLRPAKESA